MNRTLGEPQSQYGRFRNNIKLFSYRESNYNSSVSQCSAYRSTNYFIPNIVEEEKKRDLVGGSVGLFLLGRGRQRKNITLLEVSQASPNVLSGVSGVEVKKIE
jgi:hypothetical protein